MVDVADDNGEQAEKQYDSSGVDDWVQGLDAWREILHAAEILHERRRGDKYLHTWPNVSVSRNEHK